jgi:hypothetical protein
MMPMILLAADLLQNLVDNPQKWWDNRIDKVSLEHFVSLSFFSW